MKTIYNYAFRIVCIYIFALTIFALTSFDIDNIKIGYNVTNVNQSKELESGVITKIIEHTEEPTTKETDVKVEEEVIPTPTATPEPVVVEEPVVTEEPKEEVKNIPQYGPIDTSSYNSIQTVSGSLSHYGHDCYGCTGGMTASGYDISNGNIYYTDSTFGNIRIVAAGYEYPLGTILRLTNVESTPILAIVLDRGGAIGYGKKFTLDLLAESDSIANQLGVRYNVQIEMLRTGY